MSKVVFFFLIVNFELSYSHRLDFKKNKGVLCTALATISQVFQFK